MGRSIAIVGAGVTGAAAAAELRRADIRVHVFDKGRAIGGRLATRATAIGPFDHGAQFLDASRRPFSCWLDRRSDVAAIWRPRTGMSDPEPLRRVGRTGMRDLILPLLEGVDVSLGATVVAMERVRDGWRLQVSDGRWLSGFDAVLLTAPAPQVATLVSGISPVLERCSEAEMAPIWCTMLAFEKPVADGVDLIVDAAAEIAWAARDNSRPGRNQGPDRWVLHASVEWSRHHLELEKPDAADRMVQAFLRLGRVGESASGAPNHLAGHRWRYGRVARPLGVPYLLDENAGLAAAGDWCLGPDIDDAFESGTAAGQALARMLGRA